ncbi:uncharacterized protein LOC111240762 [Vigna radiata var. radiata]|uniref:Uncharacterized protein LOC111240762 n=1 Tax=Vigna radiata var. radiata TaxID=3916 RepID=A0A3Q0EPL9_VIGRR|nr:uncharacterized protein LOC111240762 [Vigna radiata var. radiata]
MFKDARIARQHPHWVGEHIWNSLLAHWNTPQYRIKCAIAQKIRASEKVVYCILEDPSLHMNMRFVWQRSLDGPFMSMRSLHRLIFSRGLTNMLMRGLTRPLFFCEIDIGKTRGGIWS